MADKWWSELPEKVNVAVAPFTYAGTMCADGAVWLAEAVWTLRTHPRVARGGAAQVVGYPTDRARNQACLASQKQGFHFLLMLDDDVGPDSEPGAEPFLPGALDFALSHPGPCVVAAPYCGSPPDERVLVMRYDPTPAGEQLPGRMVQVTRAEAADLTGLGRVAALPTGLMLVDLRVLDRLPPPWFSYEYEDPPFNTRLISTEDVVFSRNLDWVGVPQYCTWDSWCSHSKTKKVRKPCPYPVDGVPLAVRAVVGHELRREGGAG